MLKIALHGSVKPYYMNSILYYFACAVSTDRNPTKSIRYHEKNTYEVLSSASDISSSLIGKPKNFGHEGD